MRALDNLFQEAPRRLLRRTRLEDDRRHLAAPGLECRVERAEIVEPEASDEGAHGCGHARRA